MFVPQLLTHIDMFTSTVQHEDIAVHKYTTIHQNYIHQAICTAAIVISLANYFCEADASYFGEFFYKDICLCPLCVYECCMQSQHYTGNDLQFIIYHSSQTLRGPLISLSGFVISIQFFISDSGSMSHTT